MPPAKPGQLAPAGADIAADFMQYQGASYVFGGRADRPGDWDCSSAVSYVLGHDFGMTLPGGGKYGDPAYPPHYHGPVVSSYYGWTGATKLPDGTPPAAGDLCIWNGIGASGHIGIATDATHMISALNTASGTVHTPIQGYGPPGAVLTFHRINGAGQLPGASGSGSAGDLLAAALAGASIPAVMTLALFAGAIILGGLAATALASLAAYAVSRNAT